MHEDIEKTTKKRIIEKLIQSRKWALHKLVTSSKKITDLSVKFELIFCMHVEELVIEQPKELKNNETLNEIKIIEDDNNKKY